MGKALLVLIILILSTITSLSLSSIAFAYHGASAGPTGFAILDSIYNFFFGTSASTQAQACTPGEYCNDFCSGCMKYTIYRYDSNCQCVPSTDPNERDIPDSNVCRRCADGCLVGQGDCQGGCPLGSCPNYGDARCDPNNANNIQFCQNDGCWIYWYSCSSGQTCQNGACMSSSVDTGVGEPVLENPTPPANQIFYIQCPTNGVKQWDCLRAFSNDLESSRCRWTGPTGGGGTGEDSGWVGSSARFNCAGLPAGSYRAWCSARSGSSDNCLDADKIKDYQVVAAPDLTITQLITYQSGNANPTTEFDPGSYIIADIKVENLGGPETRAFSLGFWKNRAAAPTYNDEPDRGVSPAYIGWNRATLFQAPTTPGTYKGWILADTNNDIQESNEINNAKSFDYTVKSGCSGNIILTFVHNPIPPSGPVMPTASGLSNCNGKRIEFRENSCSGTLKSSCTSTSTGCEGSAFGGPSSAGAYTYAACVDKNGDNDYADSGESTSATLPVATGVITTTTSTSTTLQPGATTTTTSTTTTTIPQAEMVIAIKTTQLQIGVNGKIDVDIGSTDCRIDTANVFIRYTTIYSDILSQARKMTCTADSCVTRCSFALKPEANWITPMHVVISVSDKLKGPPVVAEADIDLVDKLSATTTTTTTTTSTTILGQSTTTSTTTSTTLPVEGLVVDITNQNLQLDKINEIKVLLGDEQCRLDKNNVNIRYTSLIPNILSDPKRMTCSDSKCVMECSYSIKPDSEWKSPAKLAVIVNISHQLVPVDKNLNIVGAPAAATTTTTQRGQTTTTTTGGIDLTRVKPDLEKLKRDLSSAKSDVDNLAERLQEEGNRQYTRYRTIGSDISDAIGKIDDIIAQINSDPRSVASRDKVVIDLRSLKTDIENIINDL